MPTIMAKTVIGFNKLVKKIKPDLIVVHGDRLEHLHVQVWDLSKI